MVLLAACTKAPEQVAITTPSPAATPPAVVVIEPTPEPKVTLAELKSLQAHVTVRREKEMSWQDALLNLPLFRFDAIRTDVKATATVGFVNGSIVNMTEDSLLIINPGTEITSWDRLLLRKGNLSAQTQKELWILTAAALVRMKPKAWAGRAKMKLAVEEGKKMKVELEEGDGLLLQTTDPGKLENAKPVKLVERKPVVIAAPAVGNDFGLNNDAVSWPTTEKVEEKARTIASLPPPSTTKPVIPPPDFVITSPADYSEVQSASVTLKGRVKGQGATSLLVNGKSVALEAKQNFSISVPLNLGANAILIQLNRNEGTPVFRRWTVIRR